MKTTTKIIVIILIFAVFLTAIISMWGFVKKEPRGNPNIPVRSVAWSGGNLEAYKQLGVNYVQIVYWIEVDKEGNVLGDDYSPEKQASELNIIKRIKESHDAGLKVWLQLYPEFYGTFGKHEGDPSIGLPSELEFGPVKDIEKFKRQMIDRVKHWADIAQKNNVELFSPTAELVIFFPRDHSSGGFYPLLAGITREIYNGPIAPKGEIAWAKFELEPEGDITFFNFTNYDYVAADIFGAPYEQTIYPVTDLESYRWYIRKILNTAERMKSIYNTKGIVFPELGAPEDCDLEHPRRGCIYDTMTQEQVYVSVINIIFEETEGKVEGYSFWYPFFELKEGTNEFLYPAAVMAIKKHYSDTHNKK